MRPLHAKYPYGLPGAGLVVLRGLVAIGLWPLAPSLVSGLGEWASFSLAATLFVAVSAGAFFPAVAVLCVCWHVASLIGLQADPWRLPMMGLLESLASALIGPGAYSFDAVLRGPSMIRFRSKD